ncbi:ABC transporter ATP-binding protein [Paenibacillus methanolicus]|uniref:Peptide/nickel transport system ATP-binding protein n=1 Tax=Paenibacillus methanolicus TaxID=582686 RepID=A0A5S5BYS6_9BACL|nr:dipeptide/oligopeptide/nickel ABC transporter ATP-binding protein [Paenibacillus methanolicus]TYP72099.1 peptide/nickel transport system ATP-binding protein [Paenibacillus methanolicus]
MSLLRAQRIHKSYTTGTPVLLDVSFALEKGQCLGLVGESGCGKSTLARCLLGIEHIDDGSLLFEGVPIHGLSERRLRPYRKHIQAVLQNPSAALNPKLTIKDSLLDPYLQFGDQVRLRHFQYANRHDFARQLLEAVELPAALADRYPHELSGGQKQRATIARAISIEPSVIILDEPTASLDVLSQAAVLGLLDRLREQLGIAYLFISHDLAAVHAMSQAIMVMQDGAIVDHFRKEELFDSERHPYTQELVAMFE